MRVLGLVVEDDGMVKRRRMMMAVFWAAKRWGRGTLEGRHRPVPRIKHQGTLGGAALSKFFLRRLIDFFGFPPPPGRYLGT